MAKRFVFRPGARTPAGLKAEMVGEELSRITEEAGALTPEAVVERASSPESPLHAAFEWDDSKAAEEHRLWQARALIRAVVVRYETRETVPAFVRVVVDGQREYRSAEVVVADVDLYSSAIASLRDRIDHARKAVSDLERLAAMSGQAAGVRRSSKVRKHLEAADEAASQLA